MQKKLFKMTCRHKGKMVIDSRNIVNFCSNYYHDYQLSQIPLSVSKGILTQLPIWDEKLTYFVKKGILGISLKIVCGIRCCDLYRTKEVKCNIRHGQKVHMQKKLFNITCRNKGKMVIDTRNIISICSNYYQDSYLSQIPLCVSKGINNVSLE